jgi:beta-N-acetylhexosaminidase
MALVGHKGDAGIRLWVGFQGAVFGEELKFLIREFHIGGIVLFRRNIEGPEQLGTLLREVQELAREYLGRPLWVSIDQEGGPVQRLVPPFTRLPSARELAHQGAGAVMDWAATAARELREVGVQVNLAPVLDVMPEGKPTFMEERSLGADPELVADLGRVWIEALQHNGVSATAKHYPGLGSAELDPHHFAPVIRWNSDTTMWRDIMPFRQAINAGVHCIMTSHALYPDLDPEWPATLSPNVNRSLLREKLGFEGVLLSDDMDMAAILENYSWDVVVRQGLLSSIDFFLLCQHSKNVEPFYRALSDATARSSVLGDAHKESLERIERFLNRHALILK